MSLEKSAAAYIDDQVSRKRRKRYQEKAKRQPKPLNRLVSLLSTTSINSSSSDMTEDVFSAQPGVVDFCLSSTNPETNPMIDSFIDSAKNSTDDEDARSDIEIASEDFSSQSTSSITNDIEHEDQVNSLLSDAFFGFDTRNLHSSTDYTVHDFSIDLLEFFRDAHLPNSLRHRLLCLFEKYMPTSSNVPKSTDELINAIGIEKFHQIEKLCSRCCSPINVNRCSNLNCNNHNDGHLTNDCTVDVVTFDIEKQIHLLYQKHSALLQLYQSQARHRSMTDREDIVGGEVYQKLLLSNPDFFITLMLHSDGIPLYRSRSCSAWPILGAVIELPPYCRNRRENILLLSVWVGKEKPNFDVVLSKLSYQISRLKETGLRIGNEKNIKIYLPMLMGDMPALSDMVKFVLPNAYYACMFCKAKGVYSHDGHCILYPSHMKAELRSHVDFDDCVQSSHTGSRISREKMAGVKGISPFKQFLDVPLPHSLVIDGMHTVFLCHAKKLLCHLKTILSKQSLQIISIKMRSLSYIHDVLRRPRSFGNIERWKASEIRIYILYLSLPLLVEHLPDDESSDLALYTIVLRLLHDEWHNDAERVTAVSSLIDLYISNLTVKVSENIRPSKLLTISTHTHYHLPIQCRKFGRLDWLQNFVFESFLGYAKNFVKGPHGAGEQIALGFTMNFLLSKIKQSISQLGHFEIDRNIFGSNVINVEKYVTLAKFILDHNHSGSKPVVFSRLHRFNTTFHSFLYSRKGQTCSYLVSYMKNKIVQYGFILCFALLGETCFFIVQKLNLSNLSITSFFSSKPCVIAIKSLLDKLFVFCPQTDVNLIKSSDFDMCDVESLQFRCFSVPMQNEVMCVIPYPCAYSYN